MEPVPATSLRTSVPTSYDKRLMVFAGRGSQELGGKIAGKLGISLGNVELKTFSNGEVYCRYLESIRGADIFIVQSTHAPVNRNLMELLLMIDAAKGASAHRIIAVTPWFGYSRQDKKSAPREPISARLVAHMLETAGADRVLTMHLHAGQVQGFFQIPVDHLIARPMLTQYFLDKTGAGGVRRRLAGRRAAPSWRRSSPASSACARRSSPRSGPSTTSPRRATSSATSPARPRSSSTT